MPFNNPVVGGTTLIRDAIHSPNYVAGTSGWTINKDGTVEFTSALLRGALEVGSSTGPQIQITPALPQPTIYFTGADPASDVAFINGPDNGAGKPVAIGVNSGKRLAADGLTLINERLWLTAGNGGGSLQTIGPTQTSVGGKITVKESYAQLAAFRVAGGNGPAITITAGPPSQVLIDSDVDTLQIDAGTTIVLHPINATVPGGTAAETWHTASLNANWSEFVPATYGHVQYKLLPDGHVHLRGIASRGTGAGTAIFTLPAGYRPTSQLLFACSAGSGTAVGDVRVGTDGVVTAPNTAVGALTSLSNVYIPTD